MAKKSTERVRRYRERQRQKSLAAQAAFDKHLAEIDPFDADVMQGYWDAWKGKIPGVRGRDRIVALDRVAEWRKLIRTKDEAPGRTLQIIFHRSDERPEPKDVTDTERPALGPGSGFGEAAGGGYGQETGEGSGG